MFAWPAAHGEDYCKAENRRTTSIDKPNNFAKGSRDNLNELSSSSRLSEPEELSRHKGFFGLEGMRRTIFSSMAPSSSEDSFSTSNESESTEVNTQQVSRTPEPTSQYSTERPITSYPNSFSSLSPPSVGFGTNIRQYTRGAEEAPDFSGRAIRQLLEPHLRLARSLREQARRRALHMMPTASDLLDIDASIASSVGVPYTALRRERPFLFDEHSFPLHTALAQALQVPELSQVHQYYPTQLSDLSRLLDKKPGYKAAFLAAYDAFVMQFCIPLLHSMAMGKKVFHVTAPEDSIITYRYQAFPTLSVVPPHRHQGEANNEAKENSTSGPRCDSAAGYSMGYLNFHVPLTASYGTNALYCESHPGREDWHPLQTKAVGMGYLFDGARCLHFDLDNTTETTRLSLDFRVLIYRHHTPRMGATDCGSTVVEDGVLCPARLLEDKHSMNQAGFYEEAIVDMRQPGSAFGIAIKKRHLAKSRHHKDITNAPAAGVPCF